MDSVLKISSLSDVSPFKTKWSVRVRVLHTWVSFSHQAGASLHMVLTDENGIKIHATCKQSLLQQFEKQCGVGEWKVITNFTLGSACGLDRHTSHVFKMHFMKETSIIDCPLACPNMFLELHDFVSISNGSSDPRFRIDVVGEITDLGGVKLENNERKEVTTIEFTLRDINNIRLPCLIMGKLAANLSQDVNQLKIGDICLLRFAKICNYKGELHLSNAFDSSLLIVNPDIEEARAIKQKFRDDGNYLSVVQNVTDKMPDQKKSVRWSQYPFKTIQEMRRSAKGGNCRVICSVYAIDTINGWYYVACAICKNKVFKQTIIFGETDVPSWWCTSCHKAVTKVSPRYKLDLLVQDQTGESRFTLLDSVATSMVEIPAAKIVSASLNEDEFADSLPPHLVAIVGNYYGFGITIDEHNEFSQVENFSASKVWTLHDVIWKKAKELHQNSAESKKKHEALESRESAGRKSG